MFFKSFLSVMILLVSGEVYATPIIPILAGAYVQYKKMCPDGFISVDDNQLQKAAMSASTSIEWNKTHPQNQNAPVEKIYCKPVPTTEKTSTFFSVIKDAVSSHINEKPTVIYSDTYKRNHHLDQYKDNNQ